MPLATLPPIDAWGPQDAKNAVTQTLGDDYAANYLMLEKKDFWQDGRNWPGHRTGDAGLDGAILANVKQQYIGDDIISETQENYVNGLMGYEPGVTLDPLDPLPDDAGDEAREAVEAEVESAMRALSAWWDKRAYWRKCRQAIKRSRYAQLRERPTVGRGALRFWVPPSGLERIRPAPGRPAGRAFPTGLPLADALDRIEVDDVAPNAATVYVDPVTRERAAVVIVGEENARNERVEVWTVEGRGREAVTRLQVLSGDGANAIRARARTTAAAEPASSQFAVNLGGRLPVVEAEGDMVVTKPTRDLVNLLNFITSTLPPTVETAGFKQRYLTNVEPPGMWLPFPPTGQPPLEKKDEGGRTYWKHRVNWQLGAHITAELIGVRTYNPETEREEFASPGVTIEAPTDPEYVTKAMERVASIIYKRQRQGHFATMDSAQLSGVAYQQHRAQHEADLNNGRAAAEGLVREGLEVVLAYAALMSPEAALLLERYRIVVNLHPHAGPVMPEESAAVIAQKSARVISRETAMARLGVEDTVAEAGLIDEDPEAKAELSLKQATAAKAWVDAGTSYLAAALLAGMSDDDAELFETGMREADRKRAEEERQRQEALARAQQGQPPVPPEPGPRRVPQQDAA
jgi:hypothetical protein